MYGFYIYYKLPGYRGRTI